VFPVPYGKFKQALKAGVLKQVLEKLKVKISTAFVPSGMLTNTPVPLVKLNKL